MPVPALRTLSFGETLDGAFSLYRRHFGVLVGTSLLGGLAAFLLVFVVFLLAAASLAGQASFGGFIRALLALGLAAGAAASLLWCMLTYVAAQAYTTGEASVAEGVNAGMRGTPAVLGSGVIAAVFLYAVTTPFRDAYWRFVLNLVTDSSTV
ncbi:MAG TPA: hypothetical protein VFQ45_21475, partial [Longimicrobium sp.]|nr:hypothetical protein [Longimicrobium sp.]